MTPQFTTPCYVRVDDKDKRKEVRDKLYSFGYLLGQHSIDMLDNMIITYLDVANTFCTGSVEMFDEIDLDGRIDCGTNIDLFLALASMRSDTNMGQWFTTKGSEYRTESWHQCQSEQMYGDNLGGEYRRATVAEIIEHFNK